MTGFAGAAQIAKRGFHGILVTTLRGGGQRVGSFHEVGGNLHDLVIGERGRLGLGGIVALAFVRARGIEGAQVGMRDGGDGVGSGLHFLGVEVALQVGLDDAGILGQHTIGGLTGLDGVFDFVRVGEGRDGKQRTAEYGESFFHGFDSLVGKGKFRRNLLRCSIAGASIPAEPHKMSCGLYQSVRCLSGM